MRLLAKGGRQNPAENISNLLDAREISLAQRAFSGLVRHGTRVRCGWVTHSRSVPIFNAKIALNKLHRDFRVCTRTLNALLPLMIGLAERVNASFKRECILRTKLGVKSVFFTTLQRHSL
jgi:hypothetical protein